MSQLLLELVFKWKLLTIYGHVSRTGDKSGGLGQIGKFGRYLMGFLYITDNTLVHLCGKLGTEIYISKNFTGF